MNKRKTAEFPIVWIPPVELSARSAVAENCEYDVCARENERVAITFGGTTARFLAVGRPVLVSRPGRAPLPAALRSGEAGPYVELNVGLARNDVDTLTIVAPIARERYPHFVQGQPESTVTLKVAAAGLQALSRPTLQILDVDGKTAIESLVVGRSRAVALTCACTGADARLRFETGRYQVVDRMEGPQGATYANLQVHRINADTAFAILEPLRETRLPAGRSRASLAITSDSRVFNSLEIAFRPYPVVESLEILRSNGTSEERTLFASESVTLRLSGPGMRWMDSLYIAGYPNLGSKVTRLHHLSDVVEARVSIPKTLRSRETLALADRDGNSVLVPVSIRPAQRPQELTFATIQFHRNSQPLVSGSHPVTRFDNAYLQFDVEAIDREDQLFGVQYLDLALVLRTPKGVEVARHSGCYAVQPPNGARPVRYVVESGCTLIDEPRLALDPLVNGFLENAIPQSILDIELRHQQHRYPNADGSLFRGRFTRQGWRTWDWSLNLPTAVMVLWGGPSTSAAPSTPPAEEQSDDSSSPPTDTAETPAEAAKAGDLAFQPTGLLGELTFYANQKPLPFSFHGGVVVSTLFEREGEALSRLALPVGVSIPIRNMTRTVDVQLYFGGMFPLVGKFFKDAYIVGYPGFGITLGK